MAEDSVDEDILNMGDRKRLLSETVLGSRGEGAARKGGQEGGDDAKGEIAQILLRALQKHMQS